MLQSRVDDAMADNRALRHKAITFHAATPTSLSLRVTPESQLPPPLACFNCNRPHPLLASLVGDGQLLSFERNQGVLSCCRVIKPEHIWKQLGYVCESMNVGCPASALR